MLKRNPTRKFARHRASSRFISLFALALLIALFSNLAKAANLAITLDEVNIASLNKLDDGARWSGSLDVPSFAATSNGSFALNSYSLQLADRNGNALLIETGAPLNGVDGVPHIETGNAGMPCYLSNAIATIASIPNSFSFFIQAQLNGTPNTGHLLTLNTIVGVGTGPNGNGGTWLLSALESNGGSVLPLEIIRGGTYTVSAVSLPATR